MAPGALERAETEPLPTNGTGHGNGHAAADVNGLRKRLVNGINGTTNGTQAAPASPDLAAESRPNSSRNDSSTTATNGQEAGSARTRFHEPQPSPQGSHRIKSFGIHQDDAGGPSGAKARIRSWGDERNGASFPRLSRPLELMRNSYDCVVIGSGYGGGVAASRMARTGESVCVLERGREHWPGEYPSDTDDALEQVHYSGEFSPGWLPKKVVNGGDPTGMYHLIFGNGQNAIVGNGLGGTSLINANVYLEVDDETLRQEQWPEEIRMAEEMLEPKEYPADWPVLPKLELLKKQAEHLGMGDKFRRVRQTTRFQNGPNRAGVEMSPSALTGQDATGLNDGSKNTTLVTYLADAWNWGAEIFCESEVRYIAKAPGREGYIIYFAWHGRNRGHFRANLHGDLMWVHAKKAVFLGAGAIGTTEILLRSRQMGLDMSDQVGQNMSGNGDIFAFGYNMDHEVNGIGRSFPSPYHPIGPCITGIIDNRHGHKNPLDGYVIEEGTVPKALSPFLQAMLELLQEAFAQTIARSSIGAIERTQTYLVMSHDSNQAVLTLKDDKPVLEFLGVGRSDHVKQLNEILAKATRAAGGTFVHNPFYALMGQQEVTVHPIGGACMASDGTGRTGVVNHRGQIFTGQDNKTYEGLIITDAAVIPTALGANPFATITALAERSVDLYAKEMKLVVDNRRNGILDLFGSPRFSGDHLRTNETDSDDEEACISSARTVIKTAERLNDAGFGFTEVMSGFIHYDEWKQDAAGLDTYDLAARIAESRCESARFFLSVQSFNTRSIINDPEHRAMLTGTFSCPTIKGSPFMVQRGGFNLFKQFLDAPGTRNMVYNFDMRGVDGTVLHFRGYKVVNSSVALSPVQFWKATSTLYVTITKPLSDDESEYHEGPDDTINRGKIVAKGIMRIQPADFASQILTMTPTGSGLWRKAISATSFLTYFTRKSMSLFMAPFTPLQYPTQSYQGFVNETLPSVTYKIVADDGVTTRMHMWEPTNVIGEPKNLFMVPGASVDHQIYALPTIRYNAVNYFTRAGYRVFIPVHRIGALMVAQNNWTTYDARLDLRASLEQIRKEYGEAKIYAIAHCMGSVALSTGLLDGRIPASWLAGVTCSQVFMNPIWNVMNMIKIMAAPLPLDWVYKAVAGSWFSCSTGQDDSYIQKALNEALRLWPDERKELCNNACCHRVSFTYGRCWNHANLNEATHRQIDRFFGGVNMTLLHLLMKQGAEGGVMTNGPLFERLDTVPENIERLRDLPFYLFVGGDNAVLSPTSTESTYEVLCDAFGTRDTRDGKGLQYKRRVVPNYGHLDCWMGRNAWRDVYPFVRQEVDDVMRGEDYVFEDPDDQFKRMVDAGMMH
ncbi:glucose-methanol-choline oxidoreductase [Apiospora phragmitis]|uniref:Cholesterol oxidase n=1 Tax=Apiospora phragmitis TaxID=2905665 RepID=A0ABR1SWV1_9PEZI